MEIRSYRDLIVWQRGLALVREIYRVSERFPGTERYGLTGQIRRAAVGVVGNIAEGHGRVTRAEYRRFLAIANGSLRETECYLDVAEELRFCSPNDITMSRQLCRETGRMLVVLMRRLASRERELR